MRKLPKAVYVSSIQQLKNTAMTLRDAELRAQVFAYEMFQVCSPCWQVDQFPPNSPLTEL